MGLFIQPAMFDLELEWMVGAGDRQEDSVIFISPCSPLLICDHSPWHKFLSLPSLLLPLKSKMGGKFFIKKILSTYLPK